MEKEKKRALRRFHNARMLKRSLRAIDSWYWSPEDHEREKEFRYEWARKRRDDMCACSCSGCGNPRNGVWNGRRERMTMPERKAEDSYLDQLNDIVYD